MIIVRYLAKEVFVAFAGITSALVFIALSNRFITYLGKSAKGELPVSLVFKAVGFYIPELLAYLMPLGFFMAILFAYGRLHADSEMIIFSSSGLGWKKITKMTFGMTGLIALLVGILTIGFIPNITKQRERVLATGQAIGMVHAITPGRFHSLDSGRMVFYVEEKKGDRLKDVFIAQKGAKNIITAQTARLDQGPITVSSHKKIPPYLILTQGFRYVGNPGELNFTKIQFEEYGRELIQPDATVQENHEIASSLRLFQSSDPEYTAELQWRIAMPLSVIILMLIAIPLAKVDPREGRFARFLPAILLYILYYNLMLVSKRWVASSSLTPWIGMWWVHILFLGIAGLLFMWIFKIRFKRLPNPKVRVSS